MTKPIQLLAAWLVGLILIDSAFLFSANSMPPNSWERLALIIAAIVNVPIFIYALFLLQTKFRPELQEDLFYSQYLDKKSNRIVTVSRSDKIEADLESILDRLNSHDSASMAQQREGKTTYVSSKAHLIGTAWTVAINDHLDNFKEIKDLLKQKGIPINDIFGSSTNATAPPTSRVLTMSYRLDAQSKCELIRLAPKMRMEWYSYFDPFAEQSEDILIGSYVTPEHGAFPVTEELLELVEKDPEPIDFKYFEREHSRSD